MQSLNISMHVGMVRKILEVVIITIIFIIASTAEKSIGPTNVWLF